VFGILASLRFRFLERAYRRLGEHYPTVSTTLELTRYGYMRW
jgi:hypothetical protein